MTKDEAIKKAEDMQRSCRAIYDDLFLRSGKECPESIQEIYNRSFALDRDIRNLPEPAQPTPTTGA